jgi:hypothetical protein
VLFVSGTGTHDRHGMTGDVDLGTHEIMDYLSDNGFIGLRFDTQGAGTTKAGDNALNTSLAPIIDDARACLAYLRSRPEVDSGRITVIGHSQGGTVALIVASSEDPPPASVVLAATPGRPLHEILEEQMVWRARTLGLDQDQLEKQLSDFREFVAGVRAGKSFAEGTVPDHLTPMARQVAWMKDHLDIDPVTPLAKLSGRLLILQGAKDFQISTRDSERLYDAAGAADVDVTCHVFPNLDHLFKHCDGEASLELYHDRTRRVDAGFKAFLLDWLRR